MTTDNYMDIRKLWNGETKALVVASEDAEMTRAIANVTEAYREIGRVDDTRTIGEVRNRIMVAALNAGDVMEKAGISRDAQAWMLSIEAGSFRYHPKDAAAKEIAATLKEYSNIVDNVAVGPALAAWLAAREAKHPGFKLATEKKDGEDKRFPNARRQMAVNKMLLKKHIHFEPIADVLIDACAQDGSPYEGVEGMSQLCTALRGEIKRALEEGDLPTVEQLGSRAMTLARPVAKVRKTKSEHASRGDVDKAAKKAAKAVADVGKLLATVLDVTPQHLDLWNRLAGEVSKLSAFPWDKAGTVQKPAPDGKGTSAEHDAKTDADAKAKADADAKAKADAERKARAKAKGAETGGTGA